MQQSQKLIDNSGMPILSAVEFQEADQVSSTFLSIKIFIFQNLFE
jgi:hypothetical protein